MVAERIWTPLAVYQVDASGYQPQGSVTPVSGRTDPSSLDQLLRDVALCNDARLTFVDDEWAVAGDPLEGALLALAAKGGPKPEDTKSSWQRISEEPFDHATRRMLTRHRGKNGETLTICKGAPEAVFELTNTTNSPAALLAAHDFTDAGYRVIAVADKEGRDNFKLVGLVAIADPPRAQSREVVDQCRAAGIRVILVTGDHPGTARAIAERTGILKNGQDNPGTTIHARVRPEDKLDIVRGLQDSGEVVAMLGDGVNDAPALRTADIGVAAGRDGTEVARQAADLVLMDDNLATVVHAVEEGRRIFANIRSFLVFGISGGLSEVGVMLVGPLLGPWAGMGQPLVPAQILWINLLTHGLTGVAFGAEPADPSEMARPPRPRDEPILPRQLVQRLVLAAILLVGTALLAGVLAQGPGQRTAVFLTLGLGQLGVAAALRSPGRGVRGLDLAIMGSVGLQLAGIVVPNLQELLQTTTPHLREWIVAALLSLVPGLVVGFVVRQERHHVPTTPSFAQEAR
jgi:P-type Ca2+ transporter type 2C